MAPIARRNVGRSFKAMPVRDGLPLSIQLQVSCR
jgi:hypothetical protein